MIVIFGDGSTPNNVPAPSTPKQKAARKVSKTKIVSKKPKKRKFVTCEHQIPPPLYHENEIIQLCAPCLVKQHILEIHKTQKFLEDRGGIFESKNIPDEDNTWTTHKTHMHRWRMIKIRCLRDIAVLEEMATEADADKWSVQESLEMWGKEKDKCFEVPGYNYAEDNEDGDEEEQEDYFSEASEYSVDLEDALLSSPLPHNGINGDWQIVPNLHKNNSPPKTPPSTPPPRRSALKRLSPYQLSSSSRRPRILSFNETATIYSPKKDPVKSPHNMHTIRESARPQKRFYQTTKGYTPKIWASPKGQEKLNTSFVRQDWEDFDQGKGNKVGMYGLRGDEDASIFSTVVEEEEVQFDRRENREAESSEQYMDSEW